MLFNNKCFWAFLAMISAPLSLATGHHANHQFDTVIHRHLTLSNFWARASIGMAPNSGGYGQILSTMDDRLISGSSPAATIVEIHEHIHDQGVMRMREIAGGLAIPADMPVVMAPGGYHVMLINLVTPLQVGGSIPLTLQFEKAGTVELQIPIKGIMPNHGNTTPGGMKGHGH